MPYVEVDTKKAWIQGRNGISNLQSLELFWTEGGDIYIGGYSRRYNRQVSGGFGGITPEEMDQLATEYLRIRGKVVYDIGFDPGKGE